MVNNKICTVLEISIFNSLIARISEKIIYLLCLQFVYSQHSNYRMLKIYTFLPLEPVLHRIILNKLDSRMRTCKMMWFYTLTRLCWFWSKHSQHKSLAKPLILAYLTVWCGLLHGDITKLYFLELKKEMWP